jgi:hypothetical protein
MAAETERDQPAQPAPKRRTRLIINISPELRRRIKIAAAERDLSVRSMSSRYWRARWHPLVPQRFQGGA